MSSDLLKLAGLDRMIHEPARLLIITVLYPIVSVDFLRLQKTLGYTHGNLSSHLAKLEAAGYVALTKKFKGKYPMPICSLTKKGRAAFVDYAENLKKVSEIKYVAVYQVKPISAITYIAPVASIQTWQDSNKAVLNFAAAAKQIEPIKLLAGGKVSPLFGPRYTNHGKLESAETFR